MTLCIQTKGGNYHATISWGWICFNVNEDILRQPPGIYIVILRACPPPPPCIFWEPVLPPPLHILRACPPPPLHIPTIFGKISGPRDRKQTCRQKTSSSRSYWDLFCQDETQWLSFAQLTARKSVFLLSAGKLGSFRRTGYFYTFSTLYCTVSDWRKRNKKRNCFNPFVSGPGRFEWWKKRGSKISLDYPFKRIIILEKWSSLDV